MNQQQNLVPLNLKSSIPNFTERVVAYLQSKVCIDGTYFTIEISFLGDKCYVTCIEENSKQYQTLQLSRDQAQKVIMKKLVEKRTSTKPARKSRKAKLNNLRECFGSLVDYIDLRFGKLTFSS